MLDIDDETCKKRFVIAKKVMNAIKNVYKCEIVYLCTMYDGPMNHFHLQLIPRYIDENRGYKNFIKPRKPYEYDINKIAELIEILKK